MAYAVADDVRRVLTPDPQVATGTPAELTDAVLTERIAAASAQVDAALAGRYAVPFTGEVPRLVHDIVVALASWLAALTYRRSVDISATDPLQLRYQWATDLLAQLARGALDLPTAQSVDFVITRQPYAGRLFGLDSFGLGYGSKGRIGTPWH